MNGYTYPPAIDVMFTAQEYENMNRCVRSLPGARRSEDFGRTGSWRPGVPKNALREYEADWAARLRGLEQAAGM